MDILQFLEKYGDLQVEFQQFMKYVLEYSLIAPDGKEVFIALEARTEALYRRGLLPKERVSDLVNLADYITVDDKEVEIDG